jgi:hypothetical protein
MFAFLIRLVLVARSRLKLRARLEAENIILRQQVIVLSRKAPSRVRLQNIDRLIFVWLYRSLPSILNAIIGENLKNHKLDGLARESTVGGAGGSPANC